MYLALLQGLSRFGTLLGEWEEDQSFTVDRNVKDFLVTEKFGMILGQPVHTDNNVKTIKFNWHEIDFESGWLLVLAVLGQMAHLVTKITFASTRSGVLEITSLAQRELIIIVMIVGVGVTVVVVAAGVFVVVESSSVVKLS
ncbi:hypothetical protein Tco_0020684, partial [Tanacetum coccineum]